MGERVVRPADLTMFEAKNTGRERVVVFGEQHSEEPALGS